MNNSNGITCMQPMTAKSRPIGVAAIQWSPANTKAVKSFLGDAYYMVGNDKDGYVVGDAVEQDYNIVPALIAKKGDYIVRFSKDEYHVYSPDKFNKVFELYPTADDIDQEQNKNLRKHFQALTNKVLGDHWYSYASDLYQSDAEVCEAIAYRANRTLWEHFLDILRGL